MSGCSYPTVTNKKYCEHVGKEHPLNFQCTDCEDTALNCNCNQCAGVFCDLCQSLYWDFNCDDVRDEWIKQNPDKDLELEAHKIQGLIKDYKIGGSPTTPTKEEDQ